MDVVSLAQLARERGIDRRRLRRLLEAVDRDNKRKILIYVPTRRNPKRILVNRNAYERLRVLVDMGITERINRLEGRIRSLTERLNDVEALVG